MTEQMNYRRPEGEEEPNDVEAAEKLAGPTVEKKKRPTSIAGKVKEAKEESEGSCDFLKKFLIIIVGLSTLGCTICIGIFVVIPIAMIAVGSIHVHNCPKERFIPIYLIVAGVVGLLKNVSSVVQRIRNFCKDHDEKENVKTNPFDGLLSTFLFAWFIAGNVWVYRTFGKFTTEDPMADDYCHPTAYWFTFVMITGTYAMILLGCLCVSIICIVVLCCMKS